MIQINSRAFFGERSAAYKNIQQIDYITRHQIFNRVIEYLSNPRIRHRRTGQVLYYVFHPQADIPERREREAEIFDFVENGFAPNYEAVRDAPSALFYNLKQTDETDLIFSKRAVAVPNFILNALVCEALEKEFGRAQVLACDGFVLSEGYILWTWAKNLSDAALSRRKLIFITV